MIKLILISFFLLSNNLPAQPLQKEIRKQHHIKKMLVRTIENFDTTEKTTWFDEKGNDSILVTPISVIRIQNIIYNGRLAEQIFVNDKGSTIYRHQYLYEGSGAYKVSLIDTNGILKMNSWYKYPDLLVKTESEDGSVTHYNYDSRGKLLIVSFEKAVKTTKEKKNNSPVVVERYIYDRNFRLQKKEVTKYGQNVSTSYSYNKEGWLEAEFESQNWEGLTFTTRSEHLYDYKGLITKTIVRYGKNRPGATIEYEYE